VSRFRVGQADRSGEQTLFRDGQDLFRVSQEVLQDGTTPLRSAKGVLRGSTTLLPDGHARHLAPPEKIFSNRGTESLDGTLP
jgi:hypothetical protein